MADPTTLIPQSTFFTLMMEFGTAHIPLNAFAKKYLGMEEHWANQQALKNKLPFPTFQLGGQKSPRLIDIVDAVNYIDEVKKKAKEEFRMTH